MEQQGRGQEGCAPSARTQGQRAAGSPEAARLAATIERRRAQDDERERLAVARKRRLRREARDKAKRDLRLKSASARDVERVMQWVYFDLDLPWPDLGDEGPPEGKPRLTLNHRMVFLLVLGCCVAGWQGLCAPVSVLARRLLIRSPRTVQTAIRRLEAYGLLVTVNNHEAEHAERYGLPSQCTQMANTYRLGTAGEALLRRARTIIAHKGRCAAPAEPPPPSPAPEPSPAAPSSRSAAGAVASAPPYKGGKNCTPMLTVDQTNQSADLAKESATPTDPGAKAPSSPPARETPAPLPRRGLTGAGGARSGPPPASPSQPATAPPRPPRDAQPWRAAWLSALCAFEKRRPEPAATAWRARTIVERRLG